MRTHYLLMLAGLCYSLLSCNLKPIYVDHPHSGRTVGISVFNNDKRIACAVTGAGLIFKTDDGGVKWQRVTAPFWAVRVEISPRDPQIWVASAFKDSRLRNNGGGIWVSRNSGQNWTRAAATASVTDAFGVSFATGSSTRVFVGTDQGVAFSDDLNTWTVVNPNPGGLAKVIAVMARGNRGVTAAGSSGVWVSNDSGNTWAPTNTALPGNVDDHYPPHNVNKLTKSPTNDFAVFLTTRVDSFGGALRVPVFYSIDGGLNFLQLNTEPIRPPRWNRACFIKAVAMPGVGPGRYHLYVGNGTDLFRVLMAPNLLGFPTPQGDWERVNTDHADPWDIGITENGPLYLASDGGIHTTGDDGRNWRLIGGSSGLNALEVYKVAGQRVASPNRVNLFMGTQDNSYFAATGGGSWRAHCNEGSHLEARKEVPNDAEARALVTCVGGGTESLSGDFGSVAAWGAPGPEIRTLPHVIQGNIHIQGSNLGCTNCNNLQLTRNNGASWIPFYRVTDELLGEPQTSGNDPRSFTLYFPVRQTNASGVQRIGLKRFTAAEFGASDFLVFYSDLFVDTDGSLELIGEEFKWYVPFGVNPENPNHLIVPDAVNDVVKVSTDGGVTWTADRTLTDLITNNGEYMFDGCVREISFNPYNPDQIFIGTLQNGLFCSTDGGRTWDQVDGTAKIPNILSFNYAQSNVITFASYGNGLWTLKNRVDRRRAPLSARFSPPDSLPRFLPLPEGKQDLAFRNLPEAVQCENCKYYVVRNGAITDIQLDAAKKTLRVWMKQGSLETFDADGKKTAGDWQIAVDNNPQQGKPKYELAKINTRGKPIRGFVASPSKMIGVVSGDDEIPVREVKYRQAPAIFASGPDLRSGAPMVPAGEKFRLSGVNFTPSKALTISIDGQNTGIAAQTDAGGHFIVEIKAPAVWGKHNITAQEPAGGKKAETEIVVTRIGDEH